MKLWTIHVQMGVPEVIGWDVQKFNEECTKFNEECIKFNEGCTKICEGCTKGSKVLFEVGIEPQTLSYRFQNEIMNDHVQMGVP